MIGRGVRLTNQPSHAKQKGVAIITALLLTTLAIAIVTSLFWHQQVQVRSIENQRLQLQKQWILRGAFDWARLILREDGKFSSVDDLTEPWAVPLHNQVAEADIRKSAQRNGMQTLRMDGERWLKEGVTSEAELLRVTKD